MPSEDGERSLELVLGDLGFDRYFDLPRNVCLKLVLNMVRLASGAPPEFDCLG